jgi:hypothetical protein
MTMSNTIRTATLAASTLAFLATALPGPASAESPFKALAGLNAQPMSAAEMEATQGKAFFPVGLSPTGDLAFPKDLFYLTGNLSPAFQEANPWLFTRDAAGQAKPIDAQQFALAYVLAQANVADTVAFAANFSAALARNGIQVSPKQLVDNAKIVTGSMFGVPGRYVLVPYPESVGANPAPTPSRPNLPPILSKKSG